jgi:phosphoethanolamine N-methyltransferase
MEHEGPMSHEPSVEERYTAAEIRRYEAIFGRHFISPGGLESTRRFLELVELNPASWVLDVGCGIGGSAFYMARTWGCHVDGIDLSAEMIRVAGERLPEEGLEALVRFFEGDCLTFQYPCRDYNLIYSREVFLHIADKLAMFATLRRNLAPDGRLLFTDYIRGPAMPSEAFQAYVDKSGYTLESLDSYQTLLIESGFAVLRADDLTGMFAETLKRELARLPNSGLKRQDIAYLEKRWQQKLRWAEGGEHGWALFLARPAD